MKLIDIVPLQEPHESQFSTNFTKEIKRRLKAMGWTKGSRIAVYQQGTGLFLALADDSPATEPTPPKQKESSQPSNPESKPTRK